MQTSTLSVLMVDAKNYRVEYAINPFMLDERGNLKNVDSQEAQVQWTALTEVYKNLGIQVHVLPSQPSLPDMVYPANCGFPFIDRNGKKTILMSQMRSKFRNPELPLFEKWFKEQGYRVEHLQNPRLCFEGNGDALFHPSKADSGKTLVWGGFGPRTDKEIYGELSQRFEFEVIPLQLVRTEFYHLDTCFAILDAQTVAIQPTAFNPESLAQIRARFKRVIEVDLREGLLYMAANCFCPNGKDVIVQRGTRRFISDLSQSGFKVHEVETSEFIKGGGSVFCLKMAL